VKVASQAAKDAPYRLTTARNVWSDTSGNLAAHAKNAKSKTVQSATLLKENLVQLVAQATL
jgi:hypothetical protein